MVSTFCIYFINPGEISWTNDLLYPKFLTEPFCPAACKRWKNSDTRLEATLTITAATSRLWVFCVVGIVAAVVVVR